MRRARPTYAGLFKPYIAAADRKMKMAQNENREY